MGLEINHWERGSGIEKDITAQAGLGGHLQEEKGKGKKEGDGSEEKGLAPIKVGWVGTS